MDKIIRHKNILIFAAVFACGAVLYCIGAGRGEMKVVLDKAAAICLQCIGIG